MDLDHFEGRSWHDLHRHATLVMIALAFLQHLWLATAPERGEMVKPQQWIAATTDAARRPASHARAHPSGRPDPMSVLLVLALPAQA